MLISNLNEKYMQSIVKVHPINCVVGCLLLKFFIYVLTSDHFKPMFWLTTSLNYYVTSCISVKL